MSQSIAVFSDRQRIVAIMLTMCASVMFSAKAIFIKFAYEFDVDTVTLLTIRMGFAVPLYLAIGFYNERFHMQKISQRQLLSIAVSGFLGYYVASYLDMAGLQYITVGLERMILYLYPTFVLVLSVIVLRQKITLREIVTILIAYCGLALIFWKDMVLEGTDILTGGFLVMLSALVFAVFMLSSDRQIKLVGSVRFTAYALSAAGFSVFIHYLSRGSMAVFEQVSAVYGWGLVLALVSTVLPTFLLAHGLKVLGVRKVSLLGVIGPVSTLVLGYLILGEQVTFIHVLGMVIILLSISSIVFFNTVDREKQ